MSLAVASAPSKRRLVAVALDAIEGPRSLGVVDGIEVLAEEPETPVAVFVNLDANKPEEVASAEASSRTRDAARQTGDAKISVSATDQPGRRGVVNTSSCSTLNSATRANASSARRYTLTMSSSGSTTQY